MSKNKLESAGQTVKQGRKKIRTHNQTNDSFGLDPQNVLIDVLTLNNGKLKGSNINGYRVSLD